MEKKTQQGVSGFNLSFEKINRESVTTYTWKKNGNILQINSLGSHGSERYAAVETSYESPLI